MSQINDPSDNLPLPYYGKRNGHTKPLAEIILKPYPRCVCLYCGDELTRPTFNSANYLNAICSKCHDKMGTTHKGNYLTK